MFLLKICLLFWLQALIELPRKHIAVHLHFIVAVFGEINLLRAIYRMIIRTNRVEQAVMLARLVSVYVLPMQ